MQDHKNLKKIADDLITEIGEDSKRVGLKDTPTRMANMWKEVFKGYDPEQLPEITVFPNNDDGIVYDQIIIDQGRFHSFCEHHMALFYGEYFFGYIPRKHVVGLSKISRVVDYFSSRMQVQERLGNDIVTFLEEKLDPAGIILVLKAHHSCKEMRGIKKEGLMTTSTVRGIFKTDISAKNEFLSLISLK